MANEKGELRLLDPADGHELWRLDGLGPSWPTLVPGQTHVLVNGVADSGKRPDKSRLGGRYVAVPLGLDKGARDWSAPLVAGRMYERTQDGGVACYDLRAR